MSEDGGVPGWSTSEVHQPHDPIFHFRFPQPRVSHIFFSRARAMDDLSRKATFRPEKTSNVFST